MPIFEFINVKKEDSLLLAVYIISLFVPNIAHPIGVFHGEKGSAKTTASKIIKMLVDPSIMETMTFPKNNEELIQVLSHNWYCNFDNMASISSTISDTLCRAVTGEGYCKRSIYTNEEDIIFSYKRCISLNGIDIIPQKDDLLDRSILFELERISDSNRQEESKLWKKFNGQRSEILGAIFNILSKAINIYSTCKIDKLNRMADFTRWGYAIAEAMHDGYGECFLRDYQRNIEKQNVEAINSNAFATTIVSLLNKTNTWSGKANDLLNELEKIAEEERIDIKNSDFPTSSNMVTKKLKAIKSNLTRLGIVFYHKHTNEGNIISLERSR